MLEFIKTESIIGSYELSRYVSEVTGISYNNVCKYLWFGDDKSYFTFKLKDIEEELLGYYDDPEWKSTFQCLIDSINTGKLPKEFLVLY